MAIESEIIGLNKLKNIIDNVENLNGQPVSKEAEKQILNTIGVAWTGTIKSNIYNSIDYYGNPLMQPKKREGNPLLDTGRLVSSINPIVKGDELRIGTPVYYSKWMNNGTAKIRPRPFIPERAEQIPDRWWEIAAELTRRISIKDIEKQLEG